MTWHQLRGYRLSFSGDLRLYFKPLPRELMVIGEQTRMAMTFHSQPIPPARVGNTPSSRQAIGIGTSAQQLRALAQIKRSDPAMWVLFAIIASSISNVICSVSISP